MLHTFAMTKSIVLASSDTASCNINSLTPGRFEWDPKSVIFKLILVIDGGYLCETSIRGLSLDLPEPLPRAKDNPGLRSHIESVCLTTHMWKHSSRVQIAAI